MNRYSITCILFIFFNSLIGQSVRWKPYLFPEKNPFLVQFNEENTKRELSKLNDLLGFQKMSLKERASFMEELFYYKKELFLNGEIYFNNGQYESYLNELLQKIIPADFSNKTMPHVYIGRSFEGNAYCLFDGSIVFNIGLLAKIETEDQIVQVLAHEFAHFYNKDVLNNFYIFRNSNKKNVIKKYLNIAHYSRIFEARADSMSFALTQKAGYNVNNCFQTFDLFTKSEDFYNKQNDENIELVTDDTINDIIKHLRSHPEAKLRKEKAKLFCEISNNKSTESVNLINKTIINEAKYEELYLLLINKHYSECTLIAFNYFLQQKENSVFLYFLIESMRRDFIIHPYMLNENFLSQSIPFLNTYKLNIFSNPENIGIEVNSSQHEFLLNNKENLKTYNSAILYFSEISEKQYYPEISLSKAMLWFNDPIKTKYHLDMYLSHSDLLYPTFAKKIYDGDLNWFGNSKNNIYLCPELAFIKNNKYEYDPYSTQYNNLKAVYLKNLESDLRSKDVTGKFLFNDSVLLMNINQKQILLQLYNSLEQIHKYYKTKKMGNTEQQQEEIIFDKSAPNSSKTSNIHELYTTTNLSFLFPDAYELLKNEKYNSITFIGLVSFGHQFKITADRIFNDDSFKQEYWDLSKINPNKLSRIVKKIVILNTRSK